MTFIVLKTFRDLDKMAAILQTISIWILLIENVHILIQISLKCREAIAWYNSDPDLWRRVAGVIKP